MLLAPDGLGSVRCPRVGLLSPLAGAVEELVRAARVVDATAGQRGLGALYLALQAFPVERDGIPASARDNPVPPAEPEVPAQGAGVPSVSDVGGDGGGGGEGYAEEAAGRGFDGTLSPDSGQGVYHPPSHDERSAHPSGKTAGTVPAAGIKPGPSPSALVSGVHGAWTVLFRGQVWFSLSP